MSIEANKAIVRNLFEQMFDHRNYAFVDEVIAADYFNHNASIQVRGPEGLKKAIQAQFTAFPDLHTTLEDIIAEGDKVVVRCIDHFTLQPDGKPVSIPWIEIIRMENGKIAEAWMETNTRLFSDQLIKEIGGG